MRKFTVWVMSLVLIVCIGIMVYTLSSCSGITRRSSDKSVINGPSSDDKGKEGEKTDKESKVSENNEPKPIRLEDMDEDDVPPGPQATEWLRRKIMAKSNKELFKYIKKGEFKDYQEPDLIKEDIKRRGLDEEWFKFLMKRLKNGSEDDIVAVLSWLKRVAELIKHEWALQLWSLMKERFKEDDICPVLVVRAVAIMQRSQLEKAFYETLARELIEMKDSHLICSAAYLGKPALKPLVEAYESGMEIEYAFERIGGGGPTGDPDAAPDIWKLMQKKGWEALRLKLMKSFLQCEGKPERKVILEWLRVPVPNRFIHSEMTWEEEDRRNSTLRAACLAAPCFKGDEEIIGALEKVFKAAVSAENYRVAEGAASALVKLLPDTEEVIVKIIKKKKKEEGSFKLVGEMGSLLGGRDPEYWECSRPALAKELKKTLAGCQSLLRTLEDYATDSDLRIGWREGAASILKEVTGDKYWVEYWRELWEGK